MIVSRWPAIATLALLAACGGGGSDAPATPAAPTIAASAPASPASVNDPVLSGTAPASSTVRIYATPDCTGTPLATTTAAASGAFSTPVAAAADASTTYRATATSAAGGVSACSSGFVYVEDSTAPAAPAVTLTEPPSPSSAAAVLARGTAEAGASVTLHADAACGAVLGTATAQGDGSWAISATVPENATTTLHARATDAAGNGSACSAGLAYVEDSAAPAAPVLTAPPSPSSVNDLALSGSAEAGATVRLYLGAACQGTPAATATASPAGSFSFPRTVAADSTTSWVASATDAAGNVSGCSPVASYVEDSTPPAAPLPATVSPASPANQNLPVVSGSAEAGAEVRIFGAADCTGPVIGTGTAAAGGTFTVAASVGDDTTTSFGARALDAAGNGSACAAGPTYVEDSTPPAVPAVTLTEPASPSSSSAVLARGTAEPGVSVTRHADAACGPVLGTVTAQGDGSWAIGTLVAENATTTLHARATDVAGNGSACSAGLAYVEDSTAPAAPALATTPASPSNLNDLAVSGTAEAGATVQLYLGAACLGTPAATATASPGGSFSIPRTVAADSTTSWAASATDAAGNVSGCSPAVTYVEDSTAPAAPTLAAATTPASPSNDPAPLVSGLAEAGATVRFHATLACTGPALATATASVGGTFSSLVPVPLNATSTIRASATDAAGNTSTCADGPSYTHDDIPPTFAGLASAAGIGTGTIRLTWAAASDGGTPPAQIGYDVCRSTTASGCVTAFAPTSSVTGLTTLDVAVAPGTRAFFLVRARDLLGNRDPNTVVRTGKTFGDGTAGVASGDSFTCVLDTVGLVTCAGANARGQLGNGQFDVAGGPVLGLPPALAVSAGERHACALVGGGRVYCWGDNVDGEVGLPPLLVPRQNTAVEVAALPAALAVECGRRHTCALLADGTVRCFGFNATGQLGGGTVGVNSEVPVEVTGLTGATGVAPGEGHSCALLADGGVRCWGAGASGQLGDGAGADSPTPVTFGATVPAAGGFVALDTGWRHTCALTAAGALYCAGENRLGQIGVGLDPVTGRLIDQLTPVPVPGLPADVRFIALGATHTCALTQGGQPLCWGEDRFEQLGDGPGGVDQPLAVPVLGAGWPTLVASHNETCLIQAGVPVCWGTGGFGERATPAALPVVGPEHAVALAAGRNHTCALFSDGEVRCFGAGASGQLGGGLTTSSSLPVDSALGFAALSAGGDTTCAATAQGRSCWGANDFGQLRDGTLNPRSTPVAPQPGWPAAVVEHGCAIDPAEGFVLCWGRNDAGQLGTGAAGGPSGGNTTPVLPTPEPARAVAVGASHSCAILRDGTVGCWGGNAAGQLGDPAFVGTLRATRGPVPGLSGVAELDAGGGGTTCARLASGGVRCWGVNGQGQVGDGTLVDRPAPTPVAGLTAAVDLAVGANHACAVLADGSVRCWGSNASGALGDGTLVDRPTPVAVSGLSGARRVVVGDGHSCALTTDGRALCWGANAAGQLGDGTTAGRSLPASVQAYP
jgi:alpha-tubulin suppressor-like RCC1 family protein